MVRATARGVKRPGAADTIVWFLGIPHKGQKDAFCRDLCWHHQMAAVAYVFPVGLTQANARALRLAVFHGDNAAAAPGPALPSPAHTRAQNAGNAFARTLQPDAAALAVAVVRSALTRSPPRNASRDNPTHARARCAQGQGWVDPVCPPGVRRALGAVTDEKLVELLAMPYRDLVVILCHAVIGAPVPKVDTGGREGDQ